MGKGQGVCRWARRGGENTERGRRGSVKGATACLAGATIISYGTPLHHTQGAPTLMHTPLPPDIRFWAPPTASPHRHPSAKPPKRWGLAKPPGRGRREKAPAELVIRGGGTPGQRWRQRRRISRDGPLATSGPPPALSDTPSCFCSLLLQARGRLS